MRKQIPGLLVLAAATAFSLWAYPRLPAEVATHFDINGVADDWSSRLFAAAMVPAVLGLMLVIVTVLPKIDPRRANYSLFNPTYWTIMTTVMVLLLGIHVLMLGSALGWKVNMSRWGFIGIGGMLIVLGNLMTRVRANWFMGSRTPWTLSSDTVWRKTHRFAGVAFVLAGCCFIAAAMLTVPWAQYAAFGATIAAGLSSVLYSYLVWRREPRETAASAPVAES